jgi:hypothetical protein
VLDNLFSPLTRLFRDKRNGERDDEQRQRDSQIGPSSKYPKYTEWHKEDGDMDGNEVKVRCIHTLLR